MMNDRMNRTELRRGLAFALTLALLMALLTGCSAADAASRGGSTSQSVSDILNAAQNGGTDSASAAVPETEAGKTDSSDEGVQPLASYDEVDIDLTKLSGTMVYSEVYNMLVTPDEYIGKTVRMSGTFTLYHDEETGMNYYACIIQDATACCAQGFEFILTDDYTYPDDYPELGGEITVAGIFDTYDEGEYTYCTLRDAIRE